MKKLGLISLALVLALGALGVGYAHWSDTVVINQTVETGKVCIGFSKQITSEPDPGEAEGKDVGSISCDFIGPIKGYVLYTGVPKPVYTGVKVWMLNAYPCYQTAVVVDVANCGNIPVKIEPLTYSMVQLDEFGKVIKTLTMVERPGPPYPPVGEKWYEFIDPVSGDPVLNMDVVNLEGDQIHPGAKNVLELDFHVKQTADQGAIYELIVTITGTQWNLVP
jgi:predicted ribosomally synthesized peptide with SipW-like signal peptide